MIILSLLISLPDKQYGPVTFTGRGESYCFAGLDGFGVVPFTFSDFQPLQSEGTVRCGQIQIHRAAVGEIQGVLFAGDEGAISFIGIAVRK